MRVQFEARIVKSETKTRQDQSTYQQHTIQVVEVQEKQAFSANPLPGKIGDTLVLDVDLTTNVRGDRVYENIRILDARVKQAPAPVHGTNGAGAAQAVGVGAGR